MVKLSLWLHWIKEFHSRFFKFIVIHIPECLEEYLSFYFTWTPVVILKYMGACFSRAFSLKSAMADKGMDFKLNIKRLEKIRAFFAMCFIGKMSYQRTTGQSRSLFLLLLE